MSGFAEDLTLDSLSRWCAQNGRALAGASMAKPLKECALLVKADILKNFQEGHGPDGSPWPPLAHPRVNSAGGDKPLNNTKLLAASVTATGEGHIEHISDTELILGTNLDYAAVQQYGHPGIVPKEAKMLAIPLTPAAERAGSPRKFPGKLHAVVKGGKGVLLDEDDEPQYALTVGPVKIPARPFAGFSRDVLAKIDKVFAEFFAGLVK